MNKARFVTSFALMACMIAPSAHAEKIYTKDELDRMVIDGIYPEQGRTIFISNRPMSMDACKSVAETIGCKAGGSFPMIIIEDTAQTYSARFFHSDGATSATCVDGQLIVSQAAYR